MKGRRVDQGMRTEKKIRRIAKGFLRFPYAVWGKRMIAAVLFLAVCLQLPEGGAFYLLERAAVISASLIMPETGLKALRERYQDILISEITIPEIPMSSASETVSDSRSETSESPETSEQQTESLPSGTISGVFSPSGGKTVFPSSSAATSRYIAPENRGTILAQTFEAIESPIYIQYGQGKIKNSTNLTNTQAEEILDIPCSIPIEDLSKPLVLIYHTHATEAYEPLDAEVYDKTYNWRSNDNGVNMVAVGDVLAQKLEEAGIGVVHLTEQHDNPSYNGAYDKSAQSVKAALEQYPSIQVILDIHRDAIQRDADTIIKAVADIDGRKAAQLMIVAGCDDDGSLGMPQWQSNFRFSAALQDILETMYPGLCRPVFFCYRKYNMDLCPNGALIEIGSHGNTLEEAQYTAELLANGLAVLLKGQ